MPSPPENSTPTWTYDKTENETLKSTSSFWSQFDYLLIEPGEEEVKVRSLSGPDRWEDVDVVEGFAGLRIVRPGEEAVGPVEERVLTKFVGEDGARLWRTGREFARRAVTRGWWVEVRMDPKIKILGRVSV